MTLEPLSPPWFTVWSTVVAVVAVDVGKTKAFAWLRRWVKPKGKPEALTGSPSYETLLENGREWDVWNLRNWLHDLVHCPWCLGHWLSAAVCLGHGIMNPVWWLVLTGVAAVPMLVYCGLLWLLEDERLNCE